MMMLFYIITLLCLCLPSNLALTVHLVPHTHDDVGWLKTYNEYYVGLNNSIQHAGVQYILDTVMVELKKNPERKFVYVEQAFFQRWWRQQDETVRNTVKSLVANGQLEFINGGWSMHDEAGTHYVDMVDQTTVGHKFILEQFGAIPTIGWQIDPFGHSATQAALLSAEVGFDGLFFGRIDYQDHALRMQNKELEFLWRASPSLGPEAQVFCHVTIDMNYNPPPGFCWDSVHCGDEQVQDDPTLEDYNVESRVNDFVNAAMEYASTSKGDLETMNVMFQMGSDFHYESATEWFKNMDKIIKAVNADGRVKAMYSTPSIYIKAKNAEPVQWNVKTDDFFPLGTGPQAYWTGFFTSRPALKRYVREASAFLQTLRQFEVLSASNGSASQTLWEAQGVVQHHDAVAGTENQHVAYDYAKLMSIGMEEGAEFITNLIGSQNGLDFSVCFLRNLSVCPASQNNPSFLAYYWNPQARSRTETIILPINSQTITVYNSTGTVPSQILTIPTNQASVNDSAKYAVAFEANFESLASNGFYFSTQNNPSMTGDIDDTDDASDLSIQNEYIKLTFDNTTGLLVNFTDLETGNSYPFTQELAFYYPSQSGTISSAYYFVPEDNTPTSIRNKNGQVQTTIINTGAFVQEVQQVFNSWATQIVRLRAHSRHVEFEWTVGPIDISDAYGKEVISRFNTTIESEGVFYTDSNGREMLTRVLNQRPSWNWTVTAPVAGNYYPINSIAAIDDGKTALIVNVDRAQGCASITDGSIECMVHRRLIKWDGGGVEALNETMGGILPDGTRLGEGLVVTGTHYVHLIASERLYDVARPLQDRVFQPLVPIFAPYRLDKDAVETMNAEVASAILDKVQRSIDAMPFRLASGVEFPINVELMSVQAWNGTNEILVRVSHQFGITDGSTYNQPATVDIQDLFSSKISSITELSLTGNQLVNNHVPYTWNTTSVGSSKPRVRIPLAGTSVTLNPLHIRTFVITLSD